MNFHQRLFLLLVCVLVNQTFYLSSSVKEEISFMKTEIFTHMNKYHPRIFAYVELRPLNIKPCIFAFPA